MRKAQRVNQTIEVVGGEDRGEGLSIRIIWAIVMVA